MRSEVYLLWLLCPMFILVGVFVYIMLDPTEYESSAKLDTCIKYANAVGIDVNDTEARSNFIKTCYEK